MTFKTKLAILNVNGRFSHFQILLTNPRRLEVLDLFIVIPWLYRQHNVSSRRS